jgi:hypothetical protein
MRFRKLRIAWSVGWGIVAVLLCVLWVRSYSHGEGLLMPLNKGTRLASHRGRLDLEPDDRATQWEWRIEYANADLDPNYDWDRWERNTPHWIIGQNIWVLVPHWFPLIVSGLLSAAPWLSWRYSLRTLLIATTLVAVLLGLIVWLR